MTRGYEFLSMVPGTMQSFRVGATALCVMALREAGEKQAHDRGVEYLIAHGHAYRDNGELIYNIWAHIYAVHALALELRANPDPRIRQAIEWHIERLVRHETYVGGWNYYDFDVGAQHSADGGTSFGTAAGLVALWEARQAGCEVPQKLVDRALRLLVELRLPDRAYIYSWGFRYSPVLNANLPRGSVGRTQAGNFALWLWGAGGLSEAEALAGLGTFEKEHIFIEMGRQRQFGGDTPLHASWYQTAPYYYYFGHYYAARLVERLSGDRKGHFARVVADGVLPHQAEDGSWWDFAMWDFHKPYGTAFAMMTLLRCR